MMEDYAGDRIFRKKCPKSYAFWVFFAFFEVPSIR